MSILGKPQVPPPKKEPKTKLPTDPSEIKIGAQSSAEERLGTDKSLLSDKYGDVKIPMSHKKAAELKEGEESHLLSAKIHRSDVLPKGGSQGRDGSIFGGEEEISRIEMRHKLRYDPKVWQAGRQSRLNLSPTDREKLEKELFPRIYGKDISKADLSRKIKMMSKERGSTTDFKRKETLRRQINFLKRIGGVK